MTKKNKTIVGVVGGLLVVGGIGAATGVGNDNNSSSVVESSVISTQITYSSSDYNSYAINEVENSYVSEPEQSNALTYKLNTGEIIDVKELDDTLIIKAKIQSQLTNELTINQNYHNIESIIKSGGDKFKEIQYWAVSDTQDGDEVKVISFTVSEEVIKGAANGTIVATQFPEKVSDLWISTSLQSTPSTSASEPPKPSSVSSSSSSSTSTTPSPTTSVVNSTPQTVYYVLNTSTRKVHTTWCRDVGKIAEENYAATTDLQEAINNGYTACGHCNPF